MGDIVLKLYVLNITHFFNKSLELGVGTIKLQVCKFENVQFKKYAAIDFKYLFKIPLGTECEVLLMLL